ncbi:MAG: indole-3-glycerol phosphate synthase TrpC [Raoultibacter sp.]|jgi:indole-3-glycerol phosphate synthase
MNILDRIVAATKERVREDKKRAHLSVQEGPPLSNKEYAFEKALRTPEVSLICEVKKASPSKGLIAPDFPYVKIAQEYETAGAAALSILTEPDFFLGKDAYLTEIRSRTHIPLLRKDFIIDPFQVEQSHRLGADAILLICSILDQDTLKELFEQADKLGLSCVVEVHDVIELERALDIGARIIGVNNRNLKSFTVDTSISLALRERTPRDVIFVSESGVKTPADITQLKQHEVDAVLIGETLMRSSNKRSLISAFKEAAS